MESKGAIAKALAAAQAEMGPVVFDSLNPHFKSRFASLSAVRSAVIPVLAKHGISLTQDLQTTERGVACFTTLWHESGESLTFGPLTMPASKPDAQGLGSAATYARRYSLMAVCGVVGDEDDDGNAASKGKAKNDPRPDTSEVDRAQVIEYAKRAAAIHDLDMGEEDIEDAIFKIHHELAPHSELYVAVMDELVKLGLFTQAAWKAAVKNHLRRQKEAA